MDPRTDSDAPPVTVEFFAMIQSRLSRRDPSLTFLGTTQTAGEALAELSAGVRSHVWNMQRWVSFYSLRGGWELTEAARRRGVGMRMVTSPAAVAMSPIASSYLPYLRVGPVPYPLMILDSRRVVVPGIDADSMWVSTDPEVLEMADRAFDAVWSVSPQAVPAGDEPPLTPRMVSIAFLLADGASDRVISRELGVSERTVSAEVREIGRRLGTANRSHTIARICGAPV